MKKKTMKNTQSGVFALIMASQEGRKSGNDKLSFYTGTQRDNRNDQYLMITSLIITRYIPSMLPHAMQRNGQGNTAERRVMFSEASERVIVHFYHPGT